MIAPLAACLAVGWVALLVAAPLLPAAAAGITYAIGALICHQIADRSFHLGAAQLPVCARCLGIYAGCAAAATIATVRVWGQTPTLSRDQTPALTPRLIVLIGALPTLATVAAEWAGLWHTSNAVRFAAGLPLGAAVAIVVIAAVATLHCDECAPRPPIASSRPPSRI